MKPQTSNKLHQLEVVDQELFASLHFRPYILYNIDLEAREMDKLLRRPSWIFNGWPKWFVGSIPRTQSLINARTVKNFNQAWVSLSWLSAGEEKWGCLYIEMLLSFRRILTKPFPKKHKTFSLTLSTCKKVNIKEVTFLWVELTHLEKVSRKNTWT